jgi:signal transduction histidine kinase
MRREEVDVAALVRDTVDSFAGTAATMGIELEAFTVDGIVGRLDGARIRQAVANLIDNALRNTPAGGRVVVALRRDGGKLAITVTDTGDGFDATFIPSAFEAFTRADAARSRSAGGAGLGLAIVRAVAESHGGTVEAANAEQGGAIVVLSVPA